MSLTVVCLAVALWIWTVDVTVYHNGYHADLNETFLVGKVDDQSFGLVKTTYECLMQTIEACKSKSCIPKDLYLMHTILLRPQVNPA